MDRPAFFIKAAGGGVSKLSQRPRQSGIYVESVLGLSLETEYHRMLVVSTDSEVSPLKGLGLGDRRRDRLADRLVVRVRTSIADTQGEEQYQYRNAHEEQLG